MHFHLHTREGERKYRKWDETIKPSKPTPSDILPPARLSLLRGTIISTNSAINYGPSVQIHDPTGDNPPSNQHITPLPPEALGHLTMQNAFISTSKVPIVFQSPSIIRKSQISCCADLVHRCEVAAGETPILTMANEKPKEESRLTTMSVLMHPAQGQGGCMGQL